ncbi:ABC transporter permease [Clostridium sp.]|uniref:ABC transporter permease n=1 Tax=Clostridium sp. TaxID=1506 RepID=UPI0025BDF36F|nr:ABC transporter permease [Clostridium sp.]
MKFENNNKEVIKRITKGSLKKNKIRNIFAIIAIVLTTFMISSVFSIGISFAKNYKTMNLRLQGTTATVSLDNPTDNQIEKIKSLDVLDSMGYEVNVGKVVLDSLTNNRTSIRLKYINKENFEKQLTPCISDIKGRYPEKENEIMASKKALEFLDKSDAKIGDKIEIPVKINEEVTNKEFILSGSYTTYGVVQDIGYILVSEEFIEGNNLTLENDGKLLMALKKAQKEVAESKLEKEVSLNGNQKFIYSYDPTEEFSNTALITVVLIVIIALFIVLSGYLLIYNIIYIAVTKDINFYGLLKTIGASPRQIKRMVKGQAFRLSIIGIPLGLILGAIVSFGIVPLAMGTLFDGAKASAMPGDVSFNPIIFIGSALFSLLTVSLSCKKPAKIAGSISPTEALRYTGSKSKKQKKDRKSTNGGKLYKMAWYNVFREKKRSIIVFLSLFMGIITFLSVNTFLSSLSVDNYIDRYVKNDFEIQNIEAQTDKIDTDMIDKIKSINGVNSINLSKSSTLQLEMSEDILMPSLKESYKRFGLSDEELNQFLNLVKDDPSVLSSSVMGIDDDLIERVNKDLKDKIDIEAFKRGEFVIADAWSYGDDYKNIKGNLTIRSSNNDISKTFDVKIINDNSSLLPSGLPTPLGIPTIYISNSVLEELDSNAVNYLLYVNVDNKYEEQIESELEGISESRGLWFESKGDKTEEFNSSQIVMNILGSGISIILILIGIINFINVMITGVNVRLKELAIMESIGMTKKQIKKMLTFEGLYYAGITTTFILTIGIAIIYGISELTRQIADYATFVFPTVPLVLLVLFIFAVCLITPSIVFKESSKRSVTERIREVEK